MLSLLWFINISKVMWEVSNQESHPGLPAAVLTLTHSVSLLRNPSFREAQKASAATAFSNLVFLSLLPQSLVAPTLSLPRQGLSGVLTRQHIIRDPVRLWHLLGES